MSIDRHKTALRRMDLSRPVNLAVTRGLVTDHTTFFDFGCGHGDDVRHLKAAGLQATGWDPNHAPNNAKISADVVNLGYVINVIEHEKERIKVVKDAWELADTALMVSARLTDEERSSDFKPYNDGVITSARTFQKFYEQNELREWISVHLQKLPVALAPGIFCIFKKDNMREEFISTTYQAHLHSPVLRLSDALYDRHEVLLISLTEFFMKRGRLPVQDEIEDGGTLVEIFGSIKRAFRVICNVTGIEAWEEIRKARTRDLLIYLALSRFQRRPKFSKLPPSIQRDVKAFFSFYKTACKSADELLFALRDQEFINMAMQVSEIGKLTPTALYVHVSALSKLSPLLRLYEGCARSYIGVIEEANIIKLHRAKPQISYLIYPQFDKDPHPKLVSSTSVNLASFRVKTRWYDRSENPPILHRKETFVGPDYPQRVKFEKLTRQEERWGLLDEPSRIGLTQGWDARLSVKSAKLKGHRVVKA